METLKQNKKIIFLVLGIVAFILLAFCPSVSAVLEEVNGFKVVFKGRGLGLSRFFMFVTILAPLAAAVSSYIVPEKSANIIALSSYGSAFVFGLLTSLSFPKVFGVGLSFSFIGWLALILCLVGAVLGYLLKDKDSF